MIVTVEAGHIGHFTIYDLDTINNKLDAAGTGYVSLEGLEYKDSFVIDNLYGSDTNNYVFNSIQGYDLDEYGNIYISSQLTPTYDKVWTTHHKKIIKIPAGARSESAESQWQEVDLSKFKGLDISGKHSEVESIQIIGENHCYLTVAYHELVGTDNKTTLNRIYELSWN